MTGAAEATVVARPPRAGLRTRSGLPRTLRICLGLIIPVVILGLWEIVAITQIIPDAVLPSPGDVAEALGMWIGAIPTPPMFYTGMMLTDVGATVSRVLLGFALATASGVVLGTAIGVWRTADAIFTPTIRVLGPIPPVTWLPVVIVVLGVGPTANLALIVLGGLFPVVSSTVTAVSGVSRELLRAGRMMGRGQTGLITHVVLPAAFPGIVGGMRIGLGLSWVMAVTSEMLAVHSGLGYTLWNAYNYFNYAAVFAAMIVTGVCGLATDTLLRLATQPFTRWHDETGVRA